MKTLPVCRTNTLIVGAGLSGLSAACHLKEGYILVEKEDRVGGLSTTDQYQGYSFDKTGHWLHLKSEYFKDFVKKLFGEEIITVNRNARIYLKGHYARYPFQANTYGLPVEIVSDCLTGFVSALIQKSQKGRKGAEPDNFADWIYYHFGKGIAEHFMIPYNSKLWGVHPREITSKWCERFVPKPKLAEVIDGALAAPKTEMGYNISFYYPKAGGIGRLPELMAEKVTDLHLKTPLWLIDYKNKIAYFRDFMVKYNHLISTLPLPELINFLLMPPVLIKEHKEHLRWSSVFYINLGIKGTLAHRDHWLYIPEPRFGFHRIGYYSHATPAMAPAGGSSLFFEFSCPPGTGVPKDFEMGQIVSALTEIEKIQPDQIECYEQRTIPYAYVTFNQDYPKATAAIHSFLRKNQIYSIGRYGGWKYNAMEDALIEGKETAEMIRATTDPLRVY